jgi:hypothetical protein
MLAALVLAVSLLVIGATFLSVALNQRSIATNQTAGAQALTLAEAGIDHALAELPDIDVDTLLKNGGSLLSQQALGDGEYSVVLTNNVAPDFPTPVIPVDPSGADADSDGYLVLTSTGRLDDVTRAIRVVVEKSAGGGSWPFPWAAFGLTKIVASNSFIEGPAGSNGDMSFSGDGPKVIGDAQATGKISDPATYVTGTATQGAPPEVFPPVVCPTTAWGPAPSGPDVSFDAGNGKLSISGDSVTTFAPGDYFFYEISKSGGGMIEIPAGGTVRIYIYNKLAMSGGGFNNQNGSAESLQIFGCPDASQGWSVTGPQTSWFTIYAPTHKIAFTGEGDKYGSFIGLEWKNSGPGNVRYDNSLSGGGPGGVTAVANSWTEVW